VRPHAVRERVHHPISLTRANGADGEASAPFAFLERVTSAGLAARAGRSAFLDQQRHRCEFRRAEALAGP
jgi:hypothetical protein